MTHPHFWPFVRRGAERETRDIAMGLADRGHATRVLTSAPFGAPVCRRQVDGVPVTYLRAPVPRRARERGWTTETAWALAATVPIRYSRADLVHALHYADAWAATRRRGRRDRPVVLKITGTIDADRMEHRPVDGWMCREAIASVDEVWCNSEYARQAMAGFGREMQVMPAGVDRDLFSRRGDRADVPTIVCTADPGEPRKCVNEPIAAMAAVLEAIPNARLLIAGSADIGLQLQLTNGFSQRVRERIHFVGRLVDAGLRRLYEQAYVTVAPARDEALGLATLESLSMGTPVAGARSGVTAELITDDVGRLWEPGDIDGCADAIIASLDLVGDPRISERCRTVTEPFDLPTLIDLTVARHEALIERG